MPPTSPEKYHTKNHGPWPFEECWMCARSRAVCKSKLNYVTREEAEKAVDEINRRGTLYPMTRYLCRWCLRHHLTKATRPLARKRAERARRKRLWKDTDSTGYRHAGGG